MRAALLWGAVACLLSAFAASCGSTSSSPPNRCLPGCLEGTAGASAGTTAQVGSATRVAAGGEGGATASSSGPGGDSGIIDAGGGAGASSSSGSGGSISIGGASDTAGAAGALARCDPAALPRPDPNAGNTVEAPGTGGCPAGMIAVSTFCVDQFEASLVRVADGSTWCPFDNPGTTPVRAISVANAVPQAYIDEVEAAAACTNAGKRLCTDSEWLRACQGPSDTTYPYGNTHQPGTCNDARAEHPAVEYFGTTDPYIYTELDNSCLDQLPETVDRTGSLTSCVTAEGAFDMMGNLNEWTNDPTGSFRGGYYVDTVLNGPGCIYVTTAHDTQYWDFGTGFRCCAD